MKTIHVLAIGLTLAIAGCSNDERPNPEICKPIDDNLSNGTLIGHPELSPAGNAADVCIHREAYRLASSSDDPAIVSRAVVQACEREVSRFVAISRASFYQAVQQSGEGDPAQSANQHVRSIEADLQNEALMRVVEGRAGNCRP